MRHVSYCPYVCARAHRRLTVEHINAEDDWIFWKSTVVEALSRCRENQRRLLSGRETRLSLLSHKLARASLSPLSRTLLSHELSSLRERERRSLFFRERESLAERERETFFFLKRERVCVRLRERVGVCQMGGGRAVERESETESAKEAGRERKRERERKDTRRSCQDAPEIRKTLALSLSHTHTHTHTHTHVHIHR